MRRYKVEKKSKKIKQNQRSVFYQMQLIANAEEYTRPSALGSQSNEGSRPLLRASVYRHWQSLPTASSFPWSWSFKHFVFSLSVSFNRIYRIRNYVWSPSCNLHFPTTDLTGSPQWILRCRGTWWTLRLRNREKQFGIKIADAELQTIQM